MNDSPLRVGHPRAWVAGQSHRPFREVCKRDAARTASHHPHPSRSQRLPEVNPVRATTAAVGAGVIRETSGGGALLFHRHARLAVPILSGEREAQDAPYEVTGAQGLQPRSFPDTSATVVAVSTRYYFLFRGCHQRGRADLCFPRSLRPPLCGRHRPKGQLRVPATKRPTSGANSRTLS